MDANDVMGVVEWALGGVVVTGLSLIAWLHRQHRELERRVDQLERENEDLEPIRKILQGGSLIAAQRLGKGVKR